jgi:ribonuclease HII
MDSYEKKALDDGYTSVVGTDEAGRGPLAGPVVAAAVLYVPELLRLGVDDSKKLSHKKRELLTVEINRVSKEGGGSVGIGMASPEEIDEINILRAAQLAMDRAVKNLFQNSGKALSGMLLVDGPYTVPTLAPKIKQQAIIKGDAKCVTIAAASIIAKTTRDKMMSEYHDEFPGYNFLRNKGYPTKEHKTALRSLGPTPIHRKSFRF